MEDDYEDSLTAYRRQLDALAQEYQRVFGHAGSRAVLDDLDDFCFAQKTTFSDDSKQMARLEGRREVLLRIKGFMDRGSG